MSAGTVLEPPPMYRIRPYFEIKKVRLPNCMYQMKPLHKLLQIKTGSDETVGPALSYLEQRQEWVLDQISQLQKRVKDLGQKLGVGPEEVGVLSQAASGGVIPDVVVSAPTSNPPYALITLCKYISRRMPISCHLHIHSSASNEVPDHLREFWKDCPQSESPAVRITLVWKSATVTNGPTMIVSPHNQTPVEGIANIARYLCREFCPDLYEGRGPEQALAVDGWLDSVAGSYLFGSSKEKTSVMRRLNSHLGSNTFLAGTEMTLADIVAYPVLGGSTDDQKLTGNVKTWLNRCRQVQGYAPVNYDD